MHSEVVGDGARRSRRFGFPERSAGQFEASRESVVAGRTPIPALESGGGPPHSKTLREQPQLGKCAKGLGLRQPSGALVDPQQVGANHRARDGVATPQQGAGRSSTLSSFGDAPQAKAPLRFGFTRRSDCVGWAESVLRLRSKTLCDASFYTHR